MALNLTFTVEGLKEIQAKYRKLGKDFVPGAKVVKALLKKFQVIMYKSVADNFRSEGRPKAWAPLKPSTLAGRRQGPKASLGAGRILQDTGRLRMSVEHGPPTRGAVSYYSSMAVEFGTRLAYAAAHQFGLKGSQAVPAHQRTLKSFVRKNGESSKGVALVREHVRQMNLPARPFLMFQDKDKARMRDVLVNHFKEWDRANRVKGGK